MPKQEITYDMLKPIIVSEDVDGSRMNVEFALPGSDEIFEASAGIRRSRTVGDQVKRNVTRGVANEVRRGVSRMLRGIFGGGFLGRTARQAATTATRETSRNVVNAPSEGDRQNAVVDAFRRVSKHFHLKDDGTWVAATDAPAMSPKADNVPTPFEKQLQDHPVNGNFERGVLARMLAHIAYADGELAEEEVAFFEDSIPKEYGKVTELAGADPVSQVEAEEIQRGARETMYMLAWTISTIDLDVADTEVAAIQSYRDTFGIPADRATELEKAAKFHVLESYFEPEITREEVFELGAKLGLSSDDAERAKIRWMKRQ